MKPPRFEYACPSTLADAVALLAKHNGNAKPMAGGQSLMPLLAFRLARPELIVDLKRIQGLDRIEIGASGVKLGAKVRGWIQMETVRVGYELWRQLNDFPLEFSKDIKDSISGKGGKDGKSSDDYGVAKDDDATVRKAGKPK